MHELPMVEGLIALLERTAGQNKLQRITLVELRIGELSDLVDECIQVYFCHQQRQCGLGFLKEYTGQ